jgi:adenine deaminase
MKTVTGNLVDLHQQKIYPATIHIEDSRIVAIHPAGLPETDLPFILPGFVDAHVHIESSMLIPSEFARLAVVHGTVATVSDPHEIANV